ncbi:MAG: hypothetical protein R2821_07070 [Flavobacteriaceae bacterium]
MREKDEKEDWSKVPVIDHTNAAVLCLFFDAKGMLFHLPIFHFLLLTCLKKEEDELHSKGTC